jgi:hypothetical protein
MPERVQLAELAALTPEAFKKQATAMAAAQKSLRAKGSPTLDARIRSFEIRYEMSSAELPERLASGEVQETADICEWLLLLAARGALVSEEARP